MKAETDSPHRRRIGLLAIGAEFEIGRKECNMPNRGSALLLVFFTFGRFGCGKSLGPKSAVMHHVSGSLIALSTPDASVAARWYQDKLGFHLVKEGQM